MNIYNSNSAKNSDNDTDDDDAYLTSQVVVS